MLLKLLYLQKSDFYISSHLLYLCVVIRFNCLYTTINILTDAFSHVYFCILTQPFALRTDLLKFATYLSLIYCFIRIRTEF